MENGMGKGSRQRRRQVSREEFDGNWGATFRSVKCHSCDWWTTRDDAEFCWYCGKTLCGECWEERGHCGHPEADEANREARSKG